MNTTPVSLLERLQKPEDSEAWNQFVTLYRPLFCAWANRLNVPACDVDDLVQEVLVLLLVNLPYFQRQKAGSFRAWLRTLTRNKWLELQRQQQPQLVGDGRTLDAVVADPVEQFWEREFEHCLLARALELMKSDFQAKTWQAVLELFLAGRTPAEVAVALGLSVGAVRSARFRVLARLRQQLAGMLNEH